MMLEINPFLWLESRKRSRVWINALTLIGGGSFLAWISFGVPGGFSWIACLVVAFGLQALAKLLAVNEAARRFLAHRESGRLEELLTLPVSVEEVVRGHYMALRRLFRVPNAIVGTAILVLGLVGYFYIGTGGAVSTATWTTAFVGLACIYLADLHALFLTGLWSGCVSKNHGRAAGEAFKRVALLPWVLFFVLLTVALLLVNMQPFWSLPGWLVRALVPNFFNLVCAWIIISAVVDLSYAMRARAQLHHRLRTLLPASNLPAGWQTKYYLKSKSDGTLFGPFNHEEIKQQFKEGALPDDCQCIEATGQSEWQLKREEGWKNLDEV